MRSPTEVSLPLSGAFKALGVVLNEKYVLRNFVDLQAEERSESVDKGTVFKRILWNFVAFFVILCHLVDVRVFSEQNFATS